MIKYLKVGLIVLLALLFQSNDSVLNSSGGDLFPVLESDIEIQKEVLKLTLRNDMYVDVYFEFFNPKEEKELTVGFVFPPKYSPEYSDVDSVDIEKRKPDIEDFTVVINDSLTDYKFGLLKDTPFTKLKEVEGEWNYVYYFKARFKSGLNIVKHTYSFNGGYDSSGGSFYNYVLLTAKNWAGKGIADFTLQIDMGSDIEFNILEDISFYDEWKIVGVGNKRRRNFYVKNGFIELKKRNLKPIEDVNIYVPGRTARYQDPDSLAYQAEIAELEELEPLSADRLRVLRNYFFARKGYKFKSEDLFKFYSRCIWYLPHEGKTSEEIFALMDEKTKRRIEELIQLEKAK